MVSALHGPHPPGGRPVLVAAVTAERMDSTQTLYEGVATGTARYRVPTARAEALVRAAVSRASSRGERSEMP